MGHGFRTHGNYSGHGTVLGMSSSTTKTVSTPVASTMDSCDLPKLNLPMHQPPLKKSRSSDDSPSVYDHPFLRESSFKHVNFQQSLLILIQFHYLNRLIKFPLPLEIYGKPLLGLIKGLLSFFERVGFVSQHFFDSAFPAAKSNDLVLLSSFSSFFKADIHSVALNIVPSSDVADISQFTSSVTQVLLSSTLDFYLAEFDASEYESDSERQWEDDCANLHKIFDQSSRFFLPHVRRLNIEIYAAEHSKSTFSTFCKLFLANSTIVHLTVEIFSITTPQVECLSDVFSSNNTLRRVTLSFIDTSNRLKDAKALLLISALSKNSNIQIIDLTHFRVSNSSVLLPLLKNSRLRSIAYCGGAFLNALKSNLPIKRVECRGLSLPTIEGLICLFEIFTINKSLMDIRVDPYFIDFEKQVFGISLTKMSTEDVISLQQFLQYCGFKELTLNNCRFSLQAFTVLCDLIRANKNLTSVDFTDCRFTDDMIMSITSAIQSNCSIRVVNLSRNDFRLKSLLIIFDLVSVNKLTRDIQVSPHSIDFSRGIIRFEKQIENSDLHLLLDVLKTNVLIKRVECVGLRSPSLQGLVNLFEIRSINKSVIDLKVDPFLLILKKDVLISSQDISSLQQFLQYCGFKELTLNNCRFSIETFTFLCDLIRFNNQTSVDLSDCDLNDEYLSIFVNLLQFDSFLSLKILKFQNNFFSNDGVITLAEALKLNSVVTEINLGGNSIDSDTRELVKRISSDRIKF
ncbi:hypothetical protein GEMRC1_010051 [Eukaryota sp. GEM-RC1]